MIILNYSTISYYRLLYPKLFSIILGYSKPFKYDYVHPLIKFVYISWIIFTLSLNVLENMDNLQCTIWICFDQIFGMHFICKSIGKRHLVITWAPPREIQQVLLPKVGWNTNPKPKTHQLEIQLDDIWHCNQITSIKH